MNGSPDDADGPHDADGPETPRAEPERPEFGPRGYLPERASQRARKIVLRSPLGLQWMIASLVAGAVVIVAAAIFLVSAGEAPGEPFVEIGPVEALAPDRYLFEFEAIVVTGAGRVRTFAVDPTDVPVFCAESRRLESEGGRVWAPTGRALDGRESLPEHPTVVVDGVVYVDPTTTEPALAPEATDPDTACF